MSKYDPAYRRPMLTIVCACGKTREIRRSNASWVTSCAPCALKAGRAKSAAVRASPPEAKAANDAWSYYRCNARAKGLPFALSKDEFMRLRAGHCHYCGMAGPNGIDRRDSGAGYILSNVVPCCAPCNYGKRDMAEGAFLQWVGRVHEHQSLLQRGRPVLLCVVEQPDGQRPYQARDDQRQINRQSDRRGRERL